ncbi:MAG: histidinol-phosphate transaminase [Candidatus Thermoplasmatota archaeon]|mgnify:CR=1 FL=1
MTTDRQARVQGWTRKEIARLKPYYKAPLAGDPLRLDQNTNLLGNNPALAKVRLADVDLTQYPTRDSDALRLALADFHGLPDDRFVCGNGGDELLDILCKAFGAPGATIATPWPSYSLYPHVADVAGLKFKPVPTKRQFAQLDVDGLLDAKPRIVVVATPNNPTGTRFATGELERLAAGLDGILVVDEAYIEYAGLKHSFLPRIEEFDNVVVLRTFSKAYGLAGLRVGYLAANEALANMLNRAKAPFNVGLLAEAVAAAALDEQVWVDAGVKIVRVERDRMAHGLTKLGLKVHASEANFLLTEPPAGASETQDALRKRGILARTFTDAALQRCLRFTVGAPQHTDRLLAALKDAEATA